MSLTFRILGCGSSGGVPRINGDWGVCDPENPKNRRTRCSLLVKKSGHEGVTHVLVDTAPDMRTQLIDARVTHLDGILFSHDHADQTHGIDDVRAIVYTNRKRIPVWMDTPTAKTLKARFAYCFAEMPGSDYPAILQDNILGQDSETITVNGQGGAVIAQAFPVAHGKIMAQGYRIETGTGGVAYTSDISAIPDGSAQFLEGLDCWIIDALRRTPHPTHFDLDTALAMVEKFKPRRAVLTNLHIDMDYAALRAELPAHIEPAFDGMEITTCADR